MKSKNINGIVYLVVSLWNYPFGGGEEYLYQTMKWMSEYGSHNYWISFSNAENQTHANLKIECNSNYTSINIPGGLNVEKLVYWMKIIKPDIVHHQGHHHDIFYQACDKLRIEYITGVHFWNGFIKLDESTSNVNILDNVDKHYIDPIFDKIYKSKHSTIYVVSDFVKECISKITGINIQDVAYSGSIESKYKIVEDVNKQIYVTAINIHKLKGGELVLKLIKELDNIPFIVIQTEYHSDDLDKKIKNAINEKNKNSTIKSFYYQRLDNIKYIYAKTKILLVPSIVDETFCKTAHEAMMNGIPVLTSGRGNLKYIIPKEYVISYEEPNKWITCITNLYTDQLIYDSAKIAMKKQYDIYSEEVCKKRFTDVICKALIKSKNNNIMIYCPWCDQGLGIQSRNYYRILKDNGYNVYILSYRPYNADSAIELQRNPEEWAISDIYYSKNDREHVSDSEILEFIFKNNIGKCLIPETCWYRVFEIAKLLRTIDVKSYAIPNIEIVRKDEIFKHTYFEKILCNNKLCENKFNSYGINNTNYIGYGLYNNSIEPIIKKIDTDVIHFLFIGGMNAFSRKHILDICEGISIAINNGADIYLTCTIQKTNNLELEDRKKIEKYITNPRIKFIQEHMTYDKIINLYNTHHVSIQVSKHEGLGLGFYEGLATGTPIITLDTPPHNEIIKDKINGWVLPCYHKPMEDNDNGLIESAYFDPVILSSKIIEIINNKTQLEKIYSTLLTNYISYHEPQHFIDRFIKSLS